jgi:fermentation-respiration switch protein FrsA (DUF1100 family)
VATGGRRGSFARLLWALVLRAVTTLIIFALVLSAVVWFGQRSLMYFPLSEVPSPAALGLTSTEPVAFETEDGLRLEGWFTPGRLPHTGATVIVFNGNAGNRAYRADLAGQLAAHGIASLVFDYRGYGGNPGLPHEEGLARDARGALQYVLGRPDVDRARVAFFGESLGSAVAIRLALEFAPAALILRSPFSSAVELAHRHYPFLPFRWLLRDRYPSIDRIGRLRSPVLVIAGDDDRVVPFDDSERLYDAAPDPKRLVTIPGADHNDDELTSGPAVIRATLEWLTKGPEA